MVKHFLAAVLALILTTVSGRAEDVLDRGAYLVRSVAVCGVATAPSIRPGAETILTCRVALPFCPQFCCLFSQSHA